MCSPLTLCAKLIFDKPFLACLKTSPPASKLLKELGVMRQSPDGGALPDNSQFGETFRAGGVLFGQKAVMPENS